MIFSSLRPRETTSRHLIPVAPGQLVSWESSTLSARLSLVLGTAEGANGSSTSRPSRH